MVVSVGRKEKILPPCLVDHFLQPRFVNGKLVRLPCGDARLIDIHDDESIVRTMAGKDRHCGPAHITSTDAKNVCHMYFLDLLKLYFSDSLTSRDSTPDMSEPFNQWVAFLMVGLRPL